MKRKKKNKNSIKKSKIDIKRSNKLEEKSRDGQNSKHMMMVSMQILMRLPMFLDSKMKMTVGKVREAAEETEVDTEEIKEEEIKEVEAEEVEDRGETEMKNLDI